ncbi:hypothetical protein NKDENANG_03943 [Candidatus Entotheonellaceae bacterium PAL068K]
MLVSDLLFFLNPVLTHGSSFRTTGMDKGFWKTVGCCALRVTFAMCCCRVLTSFLTSTRNEELLRMLEEVVWR